MKKGAIGARPGMSRLEQRLSTRPPRAQAPRQESDRPERRRSTAATDRHRQRRRSPARPSGSTSSVAATPPRCDDRSAAGHPLGELNHRPAPLGRAACAPRRRRLRDVALRRLAACACAARRACARGSPIASRSRHRAGSCRGLHGLDQRRARRGAGRRRRGSPAPRRSARAPAPRPPRHVRRVDPADREPRQRRVPRGRSISSRPVAGRPPWSGSPRPGRR